MILVNLTHFFVVLTYQPTGRQRSSKLRDTYRIRKSGKTSWIKWSYSLARIIAGVILTDNVIRTNAAIGPIIGDLAMIGKLSESATGFDCGYRSRLGLTKICDRLGKQIWDSVTTHGNDFGLRNLAVVVWGFGGEVKNLYSIHSFFNSDHIP